MDKQERTAPGGRAVRLVVLASAAVLIAVGAAGQEFRIVLEKAVKICLECIGIG